MAKHIKSIIPYRADIEQLASSAADVPEHRSKALIDLITHVGVIMDDDLDELRAYVNANAIQDPSPVNQSTIGFIGDDSPLSVATDGRTICLGIERRERLLPKDVVDRIVAARVKEREAVSGEKLRRREILDIKDDVKAELLPKAMIRARRMYVTFERSDKDVWMMVMNCSDKLADQVMAYLSGTLLAKPVIHDFKAGWSMIDRTVNAYLKEVLSLHILSPSTPLENRVSNSVSPYVDIKLKHSDHGGVTVKAYEEEGLQTAFDEYACNDYFVTTLGMRSTLTGADHIYFKLSDKFRFFGFDVSPDRLEEEYSDIDSMVACFFAESFVLGKEVQAQVGLIVEVCGAAQ